MSRQATHIAPFTFALCSMANEKHPDHNEDVLLVDRARGLAAVFDGVGGSEAGEIAAQVGARTIRRAWKRFIHASQPGDSSNLLVLQNELDVESIVHLLLEEAQQAISDEGERRTRKFKARDAKLSKLSKQPDKPGHPETTVVLALLCRQPGLNGYTTGFTHVGDSRIYFLRPGQPLQRMTQDDGYFLLKIEDNTISEEDALRIDQATEKEQLADIELEIFNKRNGISQSLGYLTPVDTALTIHTSRAVIIPGDRILLCSDGIHDNLTDVEIENTLRRAPRTTAARHIVQQALERSRQTSLRAKQDDMSAIVISCNR